VIRTARLILRPWRDEDLEPFAAMNADPPVMEHFPSLLTRAQSDETAGRIRAHFAEHGFGLWAAELLGVAPFIGFVGLHRVVFEAHFTPAVEVGWRLSRAHWGAGYATEGARAALDYGFNQLGVDEIVSMTAPGNLRSQRVMQKLGMTRDPADDFVHPKIAADSPLQPHVLFRLRRKSSQP
jgi:ribosomal-protein-alanine N-acetyltransferase